VARVREDAPLSSLCLKEKEAEEWIGGDYLYHLNFATHCYSEFVRGQKTHLNKHSSPHLELSTSNGSLNIFRRQDVSISRTK
jgi:hypothetical protein